MPRTPARFTACPDCSERVLGLSTGHGERLLVDVPDEARPARHRATVTVGDDGRALVLGEGQYPPDDRPAFVAHSLTCRAILQAKAEASIERMADRAEATS